ncbi:NEL-type E3 ubiquitin ligase domain-containing protein [Pseudomonas sp. KCJK9016]|uniref:NEL-type E3 ubiquitin ligase domain-containing protein n=1 Tax=Pseudomonas sp. KCJK9016 TaxID=3344556 RepID=UPI003905C643
MSDRTNTPPRPPVTRSIHRELLEKSIPEWLTDATSERRKALKSADRSVPDWYRQATPQQRKAIDESHVASFKAQTSLDKAMAWLQDIDTFAAPLLSKALKDRFNVEPDVSKTFVLLRKPLEIGIFGIDVSSFEVMNLPLLQAALHNFEASECESGAFHETSQFQVEGATPGSRQRLDIPLTVEQFTGLCRSLDIGAKYQAYLKEHLHPRDSASEAVLRETFGAAQKTALRAAAERALLQKDIEPKDYTSIIELIAGNPQPVQGKKRIWLCDLCLMHRRVTGCVWFSISEKYRYTDESIIYIPGDPDHPLKRYSNDELETLFRRRFTARNDMPAQDPSPTAYQRFFSRFVSYADLPRYFSEFTNDAPGKTFTKTLEPYGPLLNALLKGGSPFVGIFGIKELPPPSAFSQVPNAAPWLGITGDPQKGRGLWGENIELWGYLFDRHREKLIDDARSHAVPTADVDARVRSEKFAALLNIGMLGLTAVSMFVPVMGEVMMAVMMYPLLAEAFLGAMEWAEGDRKAAKRHLIDVGENLILLAVTAGAGKGLAKMVASRAEPVIESLHSIQLPDGSTRLWKAGLGGYESSVSFNPEAMPNARGQYELNGKYYIRIEDRFYEQFYDTKVSRWRIRHPTDPETYQPVLSHNGAGAWRYVQERPLTWNRLTLMRRMGPVAEAYSDEQLLGIADISGMSDSALRKMHMDNALPPPQLTEAVRLFDADRDVGQVIEQLASGHGIDGRYLYSLPLVTEMPRWPVDRLLEVFERNDLSGASVKYGAERLIPGAVLKPTVRISQADALSGELPARILAQLDESEITRFLGGEPARVRELRLMEFRKQLADFARTRRPALFESLYTGTSPADARVVKLQRAIPGLSEPAAQRVLSQADAEELARLDATHRVPLSMLESGHWYAREGRLTRAFAGLYNENMALPDSIRLALHSLEKLPGWLPGVRLEIREGGMNGRVIDAIGSESDGIRKYLVKRGPYYQAFNERGETLNSMSVYGSNFYSSIMHALPDGARLSLGIPEVGRDADLQRAIIDYAIGHRSESQQVLLDADKPNVKFRPPERISSERVGYRASGSTGELVPSLVARVRDVYPALTDEQARSFILEQWRAGMNDQQIHHLLNNLMREWLALEALLDHWLASAPVTGLSSQYGARFAVESLKACWRNAPLVAQGIEFRSLNIIVQRPLPELPASFLHVRSLLLMGPDTARLLKHFPNVKTLHLSVQEAEIDGMFEGLKQLRQLTELDLTVPSSQRLSSKLGGLPNLESLNLIVTGSGDRTGVSQALDVRGLRNLRRLELADDSLGNWPLGVLDLPQLQQLNLQRTRIASFPAGLYEGHEPLLRGVTMDWSRFTSENFRPVFEFFRQQPQRAGDLDAMLNDYCRGQIKRFGGRLSGFYEGLLDPFFAQWPGAQERYEAIEALNAQYTELERLDDWIGNPSDLFHGGYVKSAVAEAIRTNWRAGLLQRYGASSGSRFNLFVAGQAPVLELTGVAVDTLPTLPTEGFGHVTRLRLNGFSAPAAQVRSFVRSFSNVQNLELSECNLTGLPLQGEDLTALEHLSLRDNPIPALDVGALTRLRSLDLRSTHLMRWPAGTEKLSQLTWLDLRNTWIDTLSQADLARDELLINTNLTGAPLTRLAEADLAMARQRVERIRGLEGGTLARFALESVPNEFPPRESGSLVMSRMLPLPPVPEAGAASFVTRLQRIFPDYSEEQARQTIGQMYALAMDDTQIGNRLDSWDRVFESLTRRLNAWSFIRESLGEGWQVSSQTRSLASQRIMACWREGLLGRSGGPGGVLSLNGLQLGDLPRMPVEFAHVRELDLTGVRISEQGSNGFLEAFPNLLTLRLSGQALQVLPETISRMTGLQRLELSGVGLADSVSLYFTLAPLEHLQWLDLSHNLLQEFNVELFEELQGLDLRNNHLVEFPVGVLEARSLHALNLSGNDIFSIPENALDGAHEVLMQGTDLSDNHNLSLEALEALRNYAQAGNLDSVLGIPRDQVQWMIDGYDSGTESEMISETRSVESSEIESDEENADLQEQEVIHQLEPWLEGGRAVDGDSQRRIWQRLAAEPGNGDFFHLLERMRETLEFRLYRADLTRRTWTILEAADRFSDLRQTLFAMARTHTTCIDGRTLAFSEIEVKVFEYNTLLQSESGLAQRGHALLNLSRQLFRLEQVEKIAAESIHGRADPAEVRLQYRIGLTGGWPDGLPLPGQPRSMAFDKPVSGRRLDEARERILAVERSRFYEDLIGRRYWVDYLREKYSQAFDVLEREAAERHAQVEGRFEDLGSSAYHEALNNLSIEKDTALNTKLIELSRLEADDGMSPTVDRHRPGSSKDMTG